MPYTLHSHQALTCRISVRTLFRLYRRGRPSSSRRLLPVHHPCKNYWADVPPALAPRNRQPLPPPHRSAPGKNPAYYNYLTQDAISLFEQRTLNQLQLELFDRMLDDRRQLGVPYIESVRCFIEHYHISSISEEGLMKAFWRWKKNIKKRSPSY